MRILYLAHHVRRLPEVLGRFESRKCPPPSPLGARLARFRPGNANGARFPRNGTPEPLCGGHTPPGPLPSGYSDHQMASTDECNLEGGRWGGRYRPRLAAVSAASQQLRRHRLAPSDPRTPPVTNYRRPARRPGGGSVASCMRRLWVGGGGQGGGMWVDTRLMEGL